jgi:NAD(P)-dependent dehydrogenase (short-subunit alcohol dehydrogenase family)
MSIAVIQGCSGGLGKALTSHLLKNTSLKVYALTHRSGSAASDLESHFLEGEVAGDGKSRLSVVEGVDVGEEDGLRRAAEMVEEREGKGTVRLIACMAGIVSAFLRLPCGVGLGVVVDIQLHPEKSLSAISPEDVLSTFKINTLGHLLTYKHFVPLLPTRKEFSDLQKSWQSNEDPAKGIVGKANSLCWSMSARVGSIADNEKGGWYSYRS